VSGSGATSSLVVIGASWGGLHAVSTILAGLPRTFDTPVVVVQHRAKESDGLLAGLLQGVTTLHVCDVEDKEPIRAGHVYLAPPDYHLLVEDDYFSLSMDAAVRYSRPSIDVALASAADNRGAAAIGVLLTGANDDGARGLRHVVEKGGRALVQEPTTAEVRTMPEAGIRALAGAPRDRWSIAPLTGIAARIAELATTPASARARAQWEAR
jgi:two-component system chemotaxis response regulator CheB